MTFPLLHFRILKLSGPRVLGPTDGSSEHPLRSLVVSESASEEHFSFPQVIAHPGTSDVQWWLCVVPKEPWSLGLVK